MNYLLTAIGFNDALKRGEVPRGLRQFRVTGKYVFAGVPPAITWCWPPSKMTIGFEIPMKPSAALRPWFRVVAFEPS